MSKVSPEKLQAGLLKLIVDSNPGLPPVEAAATHDGVKDAADSDSGLLGSSTYCNYIDKRGTLKALTKYRGAVDRVTGINNTDEILETYRYRKRLCR